MGLTDGSPRPGATDLVERNDQASGLPAEGRRVALATIAEAWVRRLALGEIRYDPSLVEFRWVAAADPGNLPFKVILNGNRKLRLRTQAA